MPESWSNDDDGGQQQRQPEPDTSGFVSGLRPQETTHNQVLMLRCKVLVVGDASVGKTALAQMFLSGGSNFPKNYVMTPWVDFQVKPVQIPDTNVSVELYLFDCAGQTIFNQASDEQSGAYFKDANFAIIAYDVTNRESFKSCGKWLRDVHAGSSSGDAAAECILVACKGDARPQADDDASRVQVTRNDGETFAKTNGLAYFETSAQDGKGVEEPFHHVATTFHQRYEASVDNADRLRGAEMGL